MNTYLFPVKLLHRLSLKSAQILSSWNPQSSNLQHLWSWQLFEALNVLPSSGSRSFLLCGLSFCRCISLKDFTLYKRKLRNMQYISESLLISFLQTNHIIFPDYSWHRTGQEWFILIIYFKLIIIIASQKS